MTEKLLRANDFCECKDNPNPLIPVSTTTWRNWVKKDKAPKPVIQTGGASLWRKSDIEYFVQTGKILEN